MYAPVIQNFNHFKKPNLITMEIESLNVEYKRQFITNILFVGQWIFVIKQKLNTNEGSMTWLERKFCDQSP